MRALDEIRLAYPFLGSRKLVAADLLNDRVVPWFEDHDVRQLRVLTDRGTAYCGNQECHGSSCTGSFRTRDLSTSITPRRASSTRSRTSCTNASTTRCRTS